MGGRHDLNTNFVVKMGDEEYDNLPALRSTNLKDFLKSPRHYQYALSAEARAENSKKSCFLVGNFIHSALLEPDTLAASYLVVDASTRSTTKYKEAKEKFPNRKIILQHEKEDCEKIISAVKKLPSIMEIFEKGENEIAAYAKIPSTDDSASPLVACKAKLDIWHPEENHVYDIKTTGEPACDFRYRIKAYGYDVSAAYYIDVMNACGKEVDGFTFIVVEKDPPYGVMLYFLTKEDYQRGRKKYREALPRYLECLKSGIFPAYDLSPQPSSIPKSEWDK